MEQRNAGWWPMMLEKLKARANSLKREIHAPYLAARDSRTPWYAKAVIACVVAYALSPIDLIPDFIPVLGYLDDLVLLPLGIYLALKLMPVDVLMDARRRAAETTNILAKSWRAALVIVILWLATGIVAGIWLARLFEIDTQSLIGA